ncbi:MAG: hypothetical protein HWQ23_15170 [Nostoc sp. JL33]|uniref:hypothetical protein n=1 Tax=Nostoc sp. JL33 TaxID=2815396 RepID=UPI0025E8D4DF|nr:hypothetical protein [Nostoc sp. JL33]MBN3871565.1 hypothetical protein [Nostoc sp. JL33]
MNQLQIQSLFAINGCILLVFYTPGKCWQFRVISPDGSVFGSEKIFYTPQAARVAGVSWVSGGGV